MSFKLNLVAEEGAHLLIVDSQVPIDSIVVQSRQTVDVMEVVDNLAKINRVGDIQDPSISSLVYLSVEGDGKESYHNRIEVKIRTSEGQQGSLQLLIIAKEGRGC